jgi:catalase-peroxidase
MVFYMIAGNVMFGHLWTPVQKGNRLEEERFEKNRVDLKRLVLNLDRGIKDPDNLAAKEFLKEISTEVIQMYQSNRPDFLNYLNQKLPLKSQEKIQVEFSKKNKKKSVAIADLIVLGGSIGIEEAARKAGHKIKVPFAPGRVDATQDQTDSASFAMLEPIADGFRNYAGSGLAKHGPEHLIDKAQLLGLTLPELTVLLGGLRVMGVTHGNSKHGVLTSKVGALTNDFFINVLDMNTEWKTTSVDGEYAGFDRASGKAKWVGTKVDLLFASNSEVRAVAEIYAQSDSREKFLRDFVAAWVKAMNADRFDLKK